jgi:hypothetical protein
LDDEAPTDRVETWELEISRPSFFYMVQSRTWRCIWAALDVPREARDELREKYPITDWGSYHLGYDVVVGEPL